MPGGCTWSRRGVYLPGVPGPGGVPGLGGVPGPGGVPGLGRCTWSWGRVYLVQGVPGLGGTWFRGGTCLGECTWS